MNNYNEAARVSSVSREDFPNEKINIFDHILETRKLSFMAELFGVMAHSPGALQAVASVGEHVRFQSVLDEVLREMIICTVLRKLEIIMNGVIIYIACLKICKTFLVAS